MRAPLILRLAFALLWMGFGLIETDADSTSGSPCLDCHTKITPNIVSDWQLSKHSLNDVD